MKRVILITGTPCTGKTTIAKQLVQELGAEYINLTDFAINYGLTLGEDKERQTKIIDEKAIRQKLGATVRESQIDVVIDGHYAAAVVPTEFVSNVFVLRRSPKELKTFMQARGYANSKLWENLSAEILDSCLIEAMQTQKGKVCEIDTTGKLPDEVTSEILEILASPKKCRVGIVDWLGLLEKEGRTEQYLKA